MTNIRYICLSDMHFGQDDSILTNLNDNDNPTGIDVENPSQALAALCRGLRDLVIRANREQETETTLILAGDIMETALTTMNNASMVFQHFIEHIMPRGEKRLFDRIIYVPGNHDTICENKLIRVCPRLSASRCSLQKCQLTNEGCRKRRMDLCVKPDR